VALGVAITRVERVATAQPNSVRPRPLTHEQLLQGGFGLPVIIEGRPSMGRLSSMWRRAIRWSSSAFLYVPWRQSANCLTCLMGFPLENAASRVNSCPEMPIRSVTERW